MDKLTARGVVEGFVPTVSPTRADYRILAFVWLQMPKVAGLRPW